MAANHVHREMCASTWHRRRRTFCEKKKLSRCFDRFVIFNGLSFVFSRFHFCIFAQQQQQRQFHHRRRRRRLLRRSKESAVKSVKNKTTMNRKYAFFEEEEKK